MRRPGLLVGIAPADYLCRNASGGLENSEKQGLVHINCYAHGTR